MKLDCLKWRTRGDLLEIAELLHLSSTDEVPEEDILLALMFSCLEEFDEHVAWRKLIRENLQDIRSALHSHAFVTLLYTNSQPIVIIPGISARYFDGSLVKSDVLVYESRTLHLNNILKGFYGKHIQEEHSNQTRSINDRDYAGYSG